jgi:hypothetical protein
LARLEDTSFITNTSNINIHSFNQSPVGSESNNTFIALLDKPMDVSIGRELTNSAAKSEYLYYRTRKGHYNYAIRSLLSSQEGNYSAELNTSLNGLSKDNKVSNLTLIEDSNTPINKIEFLRKSQSLRQSRSMQFINLKYYWSNVMNPYVKIKDYYSKLESINNIYQGSYNSNIDALVINLNSLNLHLFSKWRGENGQIEYQAKLNRNTSVLQYDMTIKEAILFSNPLLKEIIENQFLIYPYKPNNKQLNERLGLIHNTELPDRDLEITRNSGLGTDRETARETNITTKMTQFNKSLALLDKRFRDSGEKRMLSSLLFNFIAPWQSISPVKLNKLTKDLDKYGLLFKNTTLKHILTTNLPKLNLIFFLNRLKEFTQESHQPTFNKLIRHSPQVVDNLDKIDRLITTNTNTNTNTNLNTNTNTNREINRHLLTILGANSIKNNYLVDNFVDSINGRDNLLGANVVTNYNVDKLELLDLISKERISTSLDTNILSGVKGIEKGKEELTKSLEYHILDTKTILGLRELYTHKSKSHSNLYPKTAINSLTIFSPYSTLDRDIDSPINKTSKGLVSYNKKLFKKLLVFLKFIFNKEIELDLTRIKNPYNETHILNQILGEVIKHKSSNFYKLTQIIRENAKIKPTLNLGQENNNYLLPPILTLKNNCSKTLQFPIHSLNELEQKKLRQHSHSHSFSHFTLNDPVSYSVDNISSQTNNFSNDLSNMETPSVKLHKNSNKLSLIDSSIFGFELDKSISSYNYIALEKWANLNQFNKHRKIYKTIVSNLTNIELKKNLVSNVEIDVKDSVALGLNGLISNTKEGKKNGVK